MLLFYCIKPYPTQPTTYYTGTSPEADFNKYVVRDVDYHKQFFPDGMEGFLKILPISSELWLGVQSITLACEDTEDVRVCVYVCIYVCVYCMYIYVYVCIYIYVYMCIYVCECMYMYIVYSV
jgi:hypothetical protein